VIRIVTAAALVVLATPAWAETLRCGNSIIKEGDSQGYVQDKCGEPESKQTYTEPVLGRYPNGNTYSAGTTSRDVWRYHRSNGSFPAVLTFEQGVLKKLEFEK
jgi:hypothetical protein